MNRKRVVVAVGAAALVAVVSVGGYRLYEKLDGQGSRPVFNPEWKRCEAGDTCVAVPAPCKDWEAVNSRHQDAATAYYNHLATVVENTELWCRSESLPAMTPFAFCLSSECTIG